MSLLAVQAQRVQDPAGAPSASVLPRQLHSPAEPRGAQCGQGGCGAARCAPPPSSPNSTPSPASNIEISGLFGRELAERRGKREGCVGRCEGRRGAMGEQRKGPRSVSSSPARLQLDPAPFPSSPSPPAQPGPRRSRQEPSRSAPRTAELVLLHSAAVPTPPPPGTSSGSRRSPGRHQRSGSQDPPPLAPLRDGSRSAAALSRRGPTPTG